LIISKLTPKDAKIDAEWRFKPKRQVDGVILDATNLDTDYVDATD
jgi:hypothetical protein